MSFILDALRKSDSQRQQQTAPGIAMAQQQVHRSGRSVWIPVLVVVLLLNAALVAWIYLLDVDVETSVPQTSPPLSATPSAARSLRKEAGAVDEPRGESATAAIRVDDPPQAATAAARAPRTSLPPPAAESAAAVPAATAAPVTTETSSANKNIRPSLPSFEQLLVAGVISMPQLHLDIHVFASEPEKRFVFINMSKYREGEVLKEGPRVEEITATGVILSDQGNRFTLERS